MNLLESLVQKRLRAEHSAHERAAFQHAAMRLHDKGFDWYIADDDLCFGVKPPDSPRASPEAGDSGKTSI
jgi:hypothetical protein